MSIRVGITGRTGSLGREIVKSKLGFSYSFFKGDIRNKNKIAMWIGRKKFDAIMESTGRIKKVKFEEFIVK